MYSGDIRENITMYLISIILWKTQKGKGVVVAFLGQFRLLNLKINIMEKFKLDIYEKEIGRTFPKIEALDINDKNEALKKICKHIGLPKDNVDLFIELENKLPNIDFNEEFTFDIKLIFKEFSFEETGDILIIWDIDNIDKVDTKALLDNWNYIWYGSSDDAIILYQKEQNKLLLITHYGRIFYSK